MKSGLPVNEGLAALSGCTVLANGTVLPWSGTLCRPKVRPARPDVVEGCKQGVCCYLAPMKFQVGLESAGLLSS